MRIYLTFCFSLLFLSTNSYTQSGWSSQNSGTSSNLYSIHFTSENTGYVSGRGILKKTTNGGAAWVTQLSGFTNDLFSIHFIDENTGMAVGGGFMSSPLIYRTTNAGINWILQNGGSAFECFSVWMTDPNTAFASSRNGIIIKTTNGGANWSQLTTGITTTLTSITFTDSITGYAANLESKIIKTTDAGQTWQQIDLSNIGELDLTNISFLNSNTGYAVDHHGSIVKTTNAGGNWILLRAGNSIDSAFRSISIVSADTVFVSGDFGRIYRTIDGGISWNRQNTGTSQWLMSVSFANGKTGYACGLNGMIIKSTNSGEPIGIIQTSSEVPQGFSLYQNYPNPFNPQTNIIFSIPAEGIVTLKIFDCLGNEIENLIHGNLKPGSYKADWNAAKYPSGVYYYSMVYSGNSATGKMIFIK